MQYSVPVIKYDRNGFRPRFRQLIFTQAAAYLVEEAKIKQRVNYSSLKGKLKLYDCVKFAINSDFRDIFNLNINFFIIVYAF